MSEPNRRPKVLIADKIADGGLDLLRQHFDVDVDLGPDVEYLLSIISGYEGLVVRSATKVTAEVIERACGFAPSVDPLLDYLEAKFGGLYGL